MASSHVVHRGNLFMASEYGKQHPSIVSVCFNPGMTRPFLSHSRTRTK